MSTACLENKNLAFRLIELETKNAKASQQQTEGVILVCEKLRLRLSRLAGVVGFATLLSRALALAKTEQPSLKNVCVKPDGTVEGLDRVSHCGMETKQVGAALIGQLLELLVTFIGQPLTSGLILDIWPELKTEDMKVTIEDKP